MKKKKIEKKINNSKQLTLFIAVIVILVVVIIYIVYHDSSEQQPYEGDNDDEPTELNVVATLEYSDDIHTLGTTQISINLTNNDIRDMEIGVGPIYLQIFILDLSNQVVYNWSIIPNSIGENTWLEPEYTFGTEGSIDMQEAAASMLDSEYQIYAICELYDHNNNIQIFTTSKYLFEIY